MKTKNIYLALLALVLSPAFLTAQENYKTISKEETALIHQGSAAYKVAVYQEPATNKKPKNVIFLIGDGMGLAQIHAGFTANHGKLFLHNFSHIGLQTTHSASNYITDSAAAGTALSSGQKTYNGAIGMNTDTISITNIREVFEQQGLATGVVSTSAVTHATPAAFVAHQPERSMYEAIAADYLKTNIDVFIGGGLKHFTERADGRDLTKDLEKKNYKVLRNIEELKKASKGKVAALLAPEHMPTVLDGRGDMLPLATKTAISLLEADRQLQ
jgi:alkaline phosphatase